MKVDKELIVLDIESTIGHMDVNKEKVHPEFAGTNLKSEIIEIGFAVFDLETLEVRNKTSLIVKPRYYQVTPETTELTTITQEMVDEEGLDFKLVTQILTYRHKFKNKVWASWGDYDRLQIQRQVQAYQDALNSDVFNPMGRRHHNIKNLYALIMGREYECGIDEACNELGIEWSGTRHRGCDDAFQLGLVCQKLFKEFRSVSWV